MTYTFKRVPEFCDSFRVVVQDKLGYLYIETECGKCNGYGVVSYYRNNTPWDGRALDGECECCGGTGVVHAETCEDELIEQNAQVAA